MLGAMDSVLVAREGAVATVTINRPERRNSLDASTKVALRDALAEIAGDESVRAVVLTGAGGHFCAGQDLAEHAEVLDSGVRPALDTVSEHYNPIVRSLATMPKPVVAAVEGNCVGAGLGLALACDLRVFGANAVLTTAFSAVGLTTDSGLAHSLPAALGEARARELILLGPTFTAEQAVGWGISGTLVEGGQAVATATVLATKLAAGPTAAFAETKRLLTDTGSRGLEDTLEAEAAAQNRLGDTADHRGAVAAFLAKQKPTFSGH